MELEPLELTVIRGEPYEKMNTDPNWLRVGYIPKPSTRLGWFLYNIVHGLAMRYPFWQVVKFSLSKGANSGLSVSVVETSGENETGIYSFEYSGGCETVTERP